MPEVEYTYPLVDFPEEVEKLSKDLSLPHPLAQILYLLDKKNAKEIKEFLFPENRYFNDPFLLPDMKKAVQRIAKAMDNKEKVVVYGDYDVDGVTSTVTLIRGFREIGFELDYYIPNRFVDGYGVNKKAIKHLIDEGVDLIITVDCGITSFAEIEYATENGIDVILTDHHLVESVIPNAYAVVNPKREDSNYPFTELAGVGVAWKLLRALYEYLRKDIPEDFLLEFVAMGTASDLVSMTDENRKIAKIGYDKIIYSKLAPIEILLKNASIYGNSLETSDIVFKISPFINASGRMKDASIALEFLLEDNYSLALKKFDAIKELNELRKTKTEEVFISAVSKIETENIEHLKQDKDFVRKGIVVFDDNWHEGILGIVAAKLVEHYNVPAIVFTKIGESFKGSGRSVGNIDIHQIVNSMKSLTERFGGHKVAIGIKVGENNVDSFKLQFEKVCEEEICASKIKKNRLIDYNLDIKEITPAFYKILKMFKPYGPDNLKSTFLSECVPIHEKPRIVGKNHIKFSICANDYEISCIGYNLGEKMETISSKSHINIVYKLDENYYRNQTTLQMRVLDVY